jgi:hypothetical protein
LLNSGLCDDAEISAAIAQLIAVSKRDDASSIFVWNRAVAIRT